MLGPRYVVLGLAPPRANWLGTVAQWAQASSIPVEFGKCLSAEELRARLASNRAFSAVLVDSNQGSLDRDLIDAARQAGCIVIVVEDRPSRRVWTSLGASAVLAGTFGQADLVDLLRQHASPIPDPQVNDLEAMHEGDQVGRAGDHGPSKRAAIVVGVVGSGGVGTSTVAMALAQGLAGSPPPTASTPRTRPATPSVPRRTKANGRGTTVAPEPAASGGSAAFNGLHLDGGVLLADMARRGDLAVLHDAKDVVPGLQELVAAHRNGHLTPRQVAALCFDIQQRGYHLLLGLRKACDWASIRPRSFEAAISSLRATYGAVVCDIEADFEAERDGGSLDVEERNVMSRSTLARADVLLAVGLPGVKGTHSLLRLLGELSAAGAPTVRIVPVCNRAPRSQRARAEISRTLAQLGGLGGSEGFESRGVASPIFLPERTLDEMAGHAARLPNTFVDPLVAAVGAVLSRAGRRSSCVEANQPRPVTPGSLGHFHEDEDDDETANG